MRSSVSVATDNSRTIPAQCPRGTPNIQVMGYTQQISRAVRLGHHQSAQTGPHHGVEILEHELRAQRIDADPNLAWIRCPSASMKRPVKSRAIGLRSGMTASSRSIISASAPTSRDFESFFSLSPGTKRMNVRHGCLGWTLELEAAALAVSHELVVLIVRPMKECNDSGVRRDLLSRSSSTSVST